MEKPVEEMTRDELIHIYVDVYDRELSELGSGYIPVDTLREAVAMLLDVDPEDEPYTISSASDFEFVDIDKAEELDAEASEQQVEWYRIHGSSARRIKKS